MASALISMLEAPGIEFEHDATVEEALYLLDQFPSADFADWASLTAYACLPPDFEAALADAQVQRAMTAVNAALKAAEAAVLPDKPCPPEATQAAIDAAMGLLQSAQARLRLPPDSSAPTPAQRARRGCSSCWPAPPGARRASARCRQTAAPRPLMPQHRAGIKSPCGSS